MQRLKSHRDFVTVLKTRTKVSSKDLVVHFHIRSVNQQVEESQSVEARQVCCQECSAVTQRRLGLAVSKAVGNAVARNHVKRRLRALAKRYEALLPQQCDVVIRAKPTANHVSFAQLDEQIARTFTAIDRKVAQREAAKHSSTNSK